MSSEAEHQIRYSDVSFFALLFLFFIQLLTLFVETIYAFGLLGTGLTAEVASVLLLLSPFLWTLVPRPPGKRLLAGLLALVLLSRGLSPFLPPLSKMLVSGAGTAAFLALLPAWLSRISRQASRISSHTMAAGFLFGLMLSITLRVMNSGVDPTVDGSLVWSGWILVVAAGLLLISSPALAAGLDSQGSRPAKAGSTNALSVGLLGALAVVLFALAAPNVVARWTGVNFPLIVAIQSLGLLLYSLYDSRRLRLQRKVAGPLVLLWNGVFVASMTLTVFFHQVHFPSEEAGYPFVSPAASLAGWVVLAIFLLTSPVVLINIAICLREIIESGSNHRQLGGSFGVAGLILLILIFGHVFTTVYDYIPLVGPFFRDMFWLVHLAAGIMLALPVFLVGSRNDAGWPAIDRAGIPGGRGLILAVGLLGGAAVIGALVGGGAARSDPIDGRRPLRVLTYNIQQGYSADGVKNLDGQLELIRALSPDVIGLQETDTNRISGGNTDLVRYFADRLGMFAYYGPRTVNGTFGVALLSNLPLEEPKTVYLYSLAEQTAAIEATIRLSGRRYQIVNTHLGNGGPIVQLENILSRLPDPERVILMGDFNFNPTSPQYQLATSVLKDSWLLGGSRRPAGIGFDPARRIDHVFVSADLDVSEAQYILSAASDHPAMIVEVFVSP